MNRNKAALASLYTSSGQRKYLNAAERARFIAAAKTHSRGSVRTLCLVLAFTGARISEALSLTAGAVDAGSIAIRTLKRRGVVVVREVPVPLELLKELEREHAISQKQPQARLWTLCRSQAWRLIKQVMAAAGITAGVHATPKGLRHGFGVHAIRSSVPINLVQRWLGHASLTTTSIYLQAIGQEERAIAVRMWQPLPDVGSEFSSPSVHRTSQGIALLASVPRPLQCPFACAAAGGFASCSFLCPWSSGSFVGPGVITRGLKDGS
jgi:integrase